ncbi:MAG TPA: glycoside hydrolase family 16 protein [Candidatus Limnocylindrales bacterium]|nr:glycoside hydrolase family 16 protein [Candidatus Limnocylindrales bacterium]
MRARRLALVWIVGLALIGASAPAAAAAGKPGYPDKVTWSGAIWSIKTSRSAVGPGPCRYDKANVGVDGQGNLRLRIQQAGSAWTCAEVIGPASFGYGTYTFTIESDVSNLDPNVVLGLFTWSDKAPYAHREIDIEFARWGSTTDPTNAQYVVQPYDTPGRLKRFTQPAGTTTTHRFTWQPGVITWESRTAAGALINDFTFSGSGVPVPGDERVRLNLWLFGGRAPLNGQAVEVLVRSFAFTP